nr:hypothetical transcript [Hymenolepis microstoma]
MEMMRRDGDEEEEEEEDGGHQDLNTSEPLGPNCQQSSTMVNPMEKIDTELVETETRDLFKELPNLPDDSSSL